MSQLYKFDEAALRDSRVTLADAVKPAPLLARMCESSMRRLNSSRLSYLEFGPYWWAVKRILIAAGYELGPETSSYMADLYTVGQGEESPELTMIAAWEAAEQIRSNYFKGSRDITVSDDGEVYSLFDADMEK